MMQRAGKLLVHGKTNVQLMLILSALVIFPTVLQAQKQKLPAHVAPVRAAFRLIHIEQPSKGIQSLEQLASSEPENSDVQYYLGLAYLETGDAGKANTAFDNGIALKEKNGLGYAGKAQAKYLEKKPSEALPLLKQALSVSRERDVEVLVAVGRAYLSGNEAMEAIKVLAKAKTLDSSNPEVHLLLGDAYMMQNYGGRAVTSYESAASADARWGLPHYKIALVFSRSKNHDMVIQSLNKAVTADPDFAPAYKKLGEICYLKKDAMNAVVTYEKYLSLSENPGDAQYQYAFFLIMARQFEKANKIFQQVVNGSGNVPPRAYKYYAYSLLEQDTTRANAEKARPLLERYIQEVKPENLQASDYGYYGKLLLKLDEDSLAIDNFARSLDMDSTQLDILQLQGSSLLKSRRFAEAANAFNRIVSLRRSPSLQELWYLGQSYYFDEQYVNADSTFNKILQRQTVDKLPLQVILFSARSKANIDSAMTEGYAKAMYESLLTRVEASPSKYKKEMVEAYNYLGAYYIHKDENVVKAKGYYEKILTLDASNAEARQFMHTLNTSDGSE